MADAPLIQRETSAYKDLEALIADRAKKEFEIELKFEKRVEKEENEYQAESASLHSRFRSEIERLKGEYQQAKAKINAIFKRDNEATEAEYAQVRQKIEAASKSERSKAKKAYEDSKWQSLALFDTGKEDAGKLRKVREKTYADLHAGQETIQGDSEPLLKRNQAWAGPEPADIADQLAKIQKEIEESIEAPDPHDASTILPDDEAAPASEPDPLVRLQKMLELADAQLGKFEKLGLPKFLAWPVYVWPFIFVTAGLVVVLGPTSLGWNVGGAVGVVAGIALAAVIRVGLVKLAKPNVASHYHLLSKALEQSRTLAEEAEKWIKTSFDERMAAIENRRTTETTKAEETMNARVISAQERQQNETKAAEAKYPALLEGIRKKRDEDLKKADEHYVPRLTALQQQYKNETQKFEAAAQERKNQTEHEYQKTWQDLIDTWTNGLHAVDATYREVKQITDDFSVDWSDPSAESWPLQKKVPAGLRFGSVDLDISQFPSGEPRDARLRGDAPTHWDVPALLPFPVIGSVLIKTFESGKGEAVKLLQTLMLRYLTSIPPGKVRFTIIDPVGLGENFSAFMHLGDYSELMVTSRIWTEAAHIEQRLIDLQAHMENVIQKYLRNEFETIEQYNEYAGEVAEPFRVVVIANFPANFNESAMKRLASIVQSGARCGVFALISIDQKAQLPQDFQLKELEQFCVNFSWRDGQIRWREPSFGALPLKLDAPPEPAIFSKLMHQSGDAAKNANRVEVPFEFIAPTPDAYWTTDSRSGIDVPLGRAGATKTQNLKLGKGTSQHVLIAGKTGSGKSTLLHAAIVNAALRYGPDNLELYLIDFKKGVEFKVYAAYEMPHARVIAVESEREFGLSVLQGLDIELKRRGDLFRDVGVQNVQGFRDNRPDEPMPRILLVIDEFQEFFVEDDKIAQEVTLLLDRLVRQGRAFGIHVILGSQTLGGSYSLPKTTLAQMAIRIALQCSEADAHLILSEENSAARLLTRPGEAIYNDANGMIEGNNLFQVVWLNDDRREAYLETMRKMANERHVHYTPPIVFEGNLPAVASKNPVLNPLLDADTWPQSVKADYAWLGDAIAIKDPTSAVFRSQSGSNLLIVGQNDEAALAMMQMAAIGLAAQHPTSGPSGTSFFLFDGSPADSYLNGKLAEIKEWLPHYVKPVGWREVGSTISELAGEVARRHSETAEEFSPIYVLVYDLQRYRDLRKSDDDFGFSSYGSEKKANPSKQFVEILKEGPAVGIHTIVWCDSVNNLNRSMDRQALKEFELRVLFQMSANDSSTLIDTPAAGKLGENRALFYSEEENRSEKFRPYGLPEPEWVESVASRLKGRPHEEPENPIKPYEPPPSSDDSGLSDFSNSWSSGSTIEESEGAPSLDFPRFDDSPTDTP